MHYLSFPLLLSSGWRLQQWYFSFALRFLSSLLKSILIVMKLCFLIDDNMHWALIDLFLWYSFCIHDYSFIRGCFLVACYYCFQKVICNFVPQGNAWLWLSLYFFGDLKIWIFFTLLSLLFFNRLRWWWNCAFWNDYNMNWALIDLFYDTLFVCMTILLSAVAF